MKTKVKNIFTSFFRIITLLFLLMVVVPFFTLEVTHLYNDIKSYSQYQNAIKNIVVVNSASFDLAANKVDFFNGGGIYVGGKNVVTNAHVVSGGKDIFITTSDAEIILGTIVYLDKKNDIAVVSLEETPKSLVPAIFRLQPPFVGEKIFQVGHPMGFNFSLSKGYVMKSLNYFQTFKDPIFLQVDSATTSGSSGGGVFDENGFVLGLTKSVVKGTEISLSIPSFVICRIPNIVCSVAEE